MARTDENPDTNGFVETAAPDASGEVALEVAPLTGEPISEPISLVGATTFQPVEVDQPVGVEEGLVEGDVQLGERSVTVRIDQLQVGSAGEDGSDDDGEWTINIIVQPRGVPGVVDRGFPGFSFSADFDAVNDGDDIDLVGFETVPFDLGPEEPVVIQAGGWERDIPANPDDPLPTILAGEVLVDDRRFLVESVEGNLDYKILGFVDFL